MDAISNTFSALADPTRRAILARLAMGEISVTELAAPFEMSMPAVSKHLRVLEHAGLVERGRQAQFRPVKLRAEPLRQAMSWIEEYRQFWEESFDRLEKYLERLQAEQETFASASSQKANGKGRTKEKKHAGNGKRHER
jgi:DNA-binding transcriptional ArsR family regulator